MKFYDIDLNVQQVLKYEPQIDMETEEPKTNKKGETKYTAEVLIKNGESFDVEKIKFAAPSDPQLNIGGMPRIEGLRLMYWTMGDNSGISFLADRVTNASGAGSGAATAKPSTPAAVKK